MYNTFYATFIALFLKRIYLSLTFPAIVIITLCVKYVLVVYFRQLKLFFEEELR